MAADKNKQIALFRYGIISDLINRKQQFKYGEKEKLLRINLDCTWQIPHSQKTTISWGIIYHWIDRYKESGGKLESLYPQRRSDIGKSRVIDTETENYLIYLTKNSNISTVREIKSEMDRRGLVASGTSLTYPTVNRFLWKDLGSNLDY